MPINRKLTDEEAELVAIWTRSSWSQPKDPYHATDVDQMVQSYAPDALSMPANHPAMSGHAEIAAWYKRRLGNYEMNVEVDVDAVDIVGELAVMAGCFRVTRRPEQGVAGVDHGGRWLSVMRKIDGKWRMWRDMDTPSPDADKFYGRLARGL